MKKSIEDCTAISSHTILWSLYLSKSLFSETTQWKLASHSDYKVPYVCVITETAVPESNYHEMLSTIACIAKYHRKKSNLTASQKHKSCLNISLLYTSLLLSNKFYTFRYKIKRKLKQQLKETTLRKVLQLIFKSHAVTPTANLNSFKGLYLQWKGRTTGIKLNSILFQRKTLHPERDSELGLWSPNILDTCFFAVLCWRAGLCEERSRLLGTGEHLWPPILHFFCIHWSTKSINAAVPSSGLQEERQRRSTWSPIPPSITSAGLYLSALADNLLPHVQFRAQNIDKIQTIFSNQKKLHTPSSPAVLTE